MELPGYDDVVEVARGGFGVVYRARQHEFDRTVAVKVLAGALDEQARQRFERERRAMGTLSDNPNIVTVHASGVTGDGRPYIVMEYTPGGSLADRLETGPLPWTEALEIGVKLAGALAVAHEAGVLHRDIKPENVLVSTYGEPMLADFGIARVAGGPETHSGVITASIAHAAPEVLEGKRATQTADVYSLASTIYALIAGQAPFARDTDESIVPFIARIATEPVPDLRPRGVPDTVCDVLEAAMAKDPTARIATATDLATRLRDARAGRVRAATAEVGAPAAPPTTARPRRWPVLLAASVVGVAVAGLVLSLLARDDDGPGPERATDTTATATTTTLRSPFVGVRYSGADPAEIDATLTGQGGALLPPETGPGGTFTLARVVGPSGEMLWLEEVLSEGSEGIELVEVRDVLPLPPREPVDFDAETGETLVFGMRCERNGSPTDELVAIFEFTNELELQDVVRAWRANRATGRFEELKGDGLSCPNEGGD